MTPKSLNRFRTTRIGLIAFAMGFTSMLFVASDGIRADEAAAAANLAFFEKSVRPLLADRCFKCHGPEKQWNGLRLDSRTALLRGGDSGPAVVPGNPDDSPLLQMVTHSDPELRMPPKEKLTDRQIADLTQWIRNGAHFPDSGKPASNKRDHWAFYPIAPTGLPPAVPTAWAQSAIDTLIRDKFADQQLEPAAAAQPWQLVRRAAFDLTGLPADPAAQEEFESNLHADRFDRLLDRMLASPAYGERWGRHWLDVARYADSNGLDENVAFGNAWRYRDYVVASWNADKPLHQFFVEQIAGDLLGSESNEQRHERLVATGFLAIGAKVLAEVDETKMEMDIVDEQVDTVGRAMLGMTFGCARCHDHKFDPIATTEYYAMAGIFKSTRTMENFKKVARWHENPLMTPQLQAHKDEHESRLKTERERIQTVVKQAEEAVRTSEKRPDPLPEKLEPLFPAEVQAELKKLREEVAALEKNGPEIPAAMGVAEGSAINVPVHVRGSHLKLGDVVQRGIPAILAGTVAAQFETPQSGRLQLANWIVDPANPLTRRVLVNRLWRWHFGTGLVRTIDNFGLLGEKPSHPELLDWLAQQLVADGWSAKRMHRRMMLSSVYQQSTIPHPQSFERDPENRFYSRYNVRRLEAEAVRDALLAATESLDRQMGGSLLKVKNREYFFDHTSKDLTDYRSPRRSIYLPLVRNNVYDVFQLLDYPDAAVPSGDRATTTVAPQALWMMNSELLGELSDRLADYELARPDLDDADRIRDLISRAYGRSTAPGDEKPWLEFLGELDQAFLATESDSGVRRRKAWSALCQTILAANEFIYLP
ncbi:MAG: hypothetical protein RIS70_2052 [Planctomycetota bacterium]|jgi:cytochrome c553